MFVFSSLNWSCSMNICSLFVINGNCLCCCHIVNTFVFLMNTVIDWSVTKCTSCWLVNQSLSDCLDNHFSLIGFCYTLIHVGQSLSLTDHELSLFFYSLDLPHSAFYTFLTFTSTQHMKSGQRWNVENLYVVVKETGKQVMAW